MSQRDYFYKPLKVDTLHTYPLKERKSKVTIQDFASPVRAGQSLKQFLDSLPNILAARDFKSVVAAIVQACRKDKPVIWGMGAHVIKCGLNPVIIELLKRGIISAIALNGAGIIHDFELAYAGHTSEEVEAELGQGRFGMAQETGELINQAINQGAAEGLGLGKAVGKKLVELAPPYIEYSLLATAYNLNIPVTVHVALGTDIIHLHPQADGANIGRGSEQDFRLLAAVVSQLEGGGVFLNIGSAVIIPEVFLKAVSLVRNLGHTLVDFVTVNLDFIRHYRPIQNVVTRPTASGGRGYSLIGHHELMLPLLAAAITEELAIRA
jgi:deoxyhypusine synthase